MNIHEFMQDKRFAIGYALDYSSMSMDESIPTTRTRIILADGESVSVQANEYCYCHPRSNVSWADLDYYDVPYYEYEIGFPSFKADEWMEYADQPEQPTETVYGYVPVDVVQAVLDAHGGIDVEATLAFKKKEEKEELSKIKEPSMKEVLSAGDVLIHAGLV